VVARVQYQIAIPFPRKIARKSMRKIKGTFLVGFPIQNQRGTLAIPDHKRSEVEGEPTINGVRRRRHKVSGHFGRNIKIAM
jgi:hypothetical protein